MGELSVAVDKVILGVRRQPGIGNNHVKQLPGRVDGVHFIPFIFLQLSQKVAQFPLFVKRRWHFGSGTSAAALKSHGIRCKAYGQAPEKSDRTWQYIYKRRSGSRAGLQADSLNIRGEQGLVQKLTVIGRA